MRTLFNHQPEAQPPNFPARRTGQPQYPIYRDHRNTKFRLTGLYQFPRCRRGSGSNTAQFHEDVVIRKSPRVETPTGFAE